MVDDPTSAVYVNDMQFTVDEAGAFEGVYTLETEGTHTINVEARKNGYAIARQTFQVTYSTGAATTPGTTGGGTSASTPGTLPSGATGVGYVTSNDLNVRSEASSGSDDTILGKLALNQKVFIMEKDVAIPGPRSCTTGAKPMSPTFTSRSWTIIPSKMPRSPRTT